MNNKLIITVLVVLLIVGFIGFRVINSFLADVEEPLEPGNAPDIVDSFEECVAAGNPVMESYPRQCSANGQTFAEDIGNELEKSDLILITTPRPNGVINSPLEVTGEARGQWFFEASFPVYLYDADGNELAVGVANASGDWMTTEFVPFSTVLNFEMPDSDTGVLVLERNNASGLPENADELVVPVKFR